MSALANEGYSFSKWEGTGVENPFIPFTRIRITEDRNVTATFEINSHQLTILPSDGGTSAGSGIYDWNSKITISATAKDGYKFSHWSGDGIEDMNSSSTNIILSSDREIKPVFSLISLANEIEGIEIAPIGSVLRTGTFFQYESGWSYHLEFGWIFPIVQNTQAYGFGTPTSVGFGVKDTFLENYIWSEEARNWIFWDNSKMSNLAIMTT